MKDVNLSHGSYNFIELQLFVKHKKFFPWEDITMSWEMKLYILRIT